MSFCSEIGEQGSMAGFAATDSKQYLKNLFIDRDKFAILITGTS